MTDNKFFGMYRGICMDIADPLEKNRIRVQVPQVLGEELSDWAWPCLPVLSNANHPDHLPHLAAEVAALLTTHATHSSHSVSVSGSTGSGGSPGHTHSFSATQTLTHSAHADHAGNTGELTHAHIPETNADEKWNDDQETNTTAEHTPHRLVPKLEQGVWTMFEGGDPNFPVWIGVF
jgi:hypothetical protein